MTINEALTTTFDRLIDQSAEYDKAKTDFRLKVADTFFDEKFNLIVNASPLLYDDSLGGSSVEPIRRSLRVTDEALSQMYGKLGKHHYGRGANKQLPGEYLSLFPDDQRAQILNWTMARTPKGAWGRDFRWMIRSDGDHARAVLDDNFPRVWNTELLRQVRRVFLEKGQLAEVQLVRPFLSPDKMDIRFWFPTIGTGVYRVGAVIRNGEIGNSKLELLAMIQGTGCTNSIVVGRGVAGDNMGYSVQHYPGANATSLMIQFYSHLPEVLNASGNLVNRMIEAEGQALPDMRQIVDGLAVEYGWDHKMKNIIDEGSNGSRTVGGLVNGITYAAHRNAEVKDAVRLDLEIIGGNLLYAPEKELVRLANQGVAGKKVRA